MGATPPTYRAYQTEGGIVAMLERSSMSLVACVCLVDSFMEQLKGLAESEDGRHYVIKKDKVSQEKAKELIIKQLKGQ